MTGDDHGADGAIAVSVGAGSGAPDPEERARQLVHCERQLRRAGLPLLIEEYSVTEDIFTRAVPFFVFVALAEVAGAVNLDWSFGANLVAVAAATAVLVGGLGLFNVVRSLPFFTRPRRVAVGELTALVLLPSLLPLIFGGQAISALLTALTNLVLVGLAWLVIGFGLPSIVRWAAGSLFSQLAASLTLLVRALPLILFFGLLAARGGGADRPAWQRTASQPADSWSIGVSAPVPTA